MSIRAYVGVPGSGKSYRLVSEGIKALANGKKYRTLFCNFAFDLDNVFDVMIKRFNMTRSDALNRCSRIVEVRNYNDLIDCYQGLILFDEAHMWLPARAYDIIPTELIAFFTQHRKVKTDILLATQRLGSVDPIVRDMLDGTYYVQDVALAMKIIMYPVARGRRILRYTLIHDDVLGKGNLGKSQSIYEQVGRTDYLILDPVLANCYDSWTIFEPPIVAIEKAMAATGGDKRRKAMASLGLEWNMSKIVVNKPGRRSGDHMPILRVKDLIDLEKRGIEPYHYLQSLIAADSSTGAPVLA
jgi:hypothetical protein